MRSPISSRTSLEQMSYTLGFSDSVTVEPIVKPAASPPGKRFDIQGLRGVGVLLVVVGHLWRWPPGAFVALDLFFVLSGFLITGVLLDVSAKFGRIYFIPFFLSRVRRLMPTALVVIVATVASFYWLFSAARGELVLRDGIYAAVFAANWHFSSQGTDYFSDHTQSPLLHYWSLSVEEQFYAVWPLLLFGILIVARRVRRPVVLLAAGMATVTVVAFGYSLWHSATNLDAAYFSTFDRVWEFGAGALLCLARDKAAALPFWVARASSWLGGAVLLVAVATMHEGMAFPAPWGLLPVLATLAIGFGGMGNHTSHMRYFANRPLVYVGDISYSLYLWHLPINLALKAFFTVESTAYYVWALALTAVFSVASYHLLEHPLRYAPWLMAAPERERAVAREFERSQQVRRVRQGWTAISGVAVIVGLVLVLQP